MDIPSPESDYLSAVESLPALSPPDHLPGGTSSERPPGDSHVDEVGDHGGPLGPACSHANLSTSVIISGSMLAPVRGTSNPTSDDDVNESGSGDGGHLEDDYELVPRQLFLSSQTSPAPNVTKGVEGGKTPARTGDQGGPADRIQIAVVQSRTKSQTMSQSAALWGLGGVGKTQMALEYAYRQRYDSEPCSVFWVHADNEATFAQDYQSIAKKLRCLSMPGSFFIKDVIRDNWTEGVKLELLDALNLSFPGGTRSFIPLGSIDTILAAERMRECLEPIPDGRRACDLEGLLLSARKIFGILVLMDKPDCIWDFLSAGVADVDLPFSLGRGSQLSARVAGDASVPPGPEHKPWSANDTNRFLDLQWVFLAPTLPFSPDDHGSRIVELDPRVVLPFLKVDDGGQDNCRQGGYSNVYRVRIHKSHDMFENAVGQPGGPQWFALKVFERGCQETAFTREAEALRRLRDHPHPHISQALAAFRHGDVYHLLFEWAECDLSTFWQRNPSPLHDATTTRWCIAQFLGIADALATLHGGIDQTGATALRCSHQDLKPQNILVFADGSNERGKWVLADFGISRFQGQETTNGDRHLGCTPAYRAPEQDDRARAYDVNGAADIWALGCVMLECVVWYLCGKPGLDRLELARVSPRGRRGVDPAFFEAGVTRSTTTLQAAVSPLKPAVRKIIDKLLDESPHHVWNKLLNLVVSDMLVVEHPSNADAKKRITALKLAERLQLLIAEHDSGGGATDRLMRQPRNADEVCHQDLWSRRFSGTRAEQLPGAAPQPLHPARQEPGIKDDGFSRVLTSSNFQLCQTVLAPNPASSPASKRKTASTEGPARKQPRLSSQPLFACPWFKLNPARFRTWSGACSGPGFEGFHRLKEHIERKHMPPANACDRCGEDCESPEGLHQHRRMKKPCEVTELVAVEGYLRPDVLAKFKGRQQWGRNLSEEAKWRMAFGIIFPDLPVLSPYYDTEPLFSPGIQSANTTVSTTTVDTTTTASTISSFATYSTGASSHLADLAESLKRPLLPHEEHALGSQLGRDLGVHPDKYGLLAQRFRSRQLRDIEMALGIPVSEESVHGGGGGDDEVMVDLDDDTPRAAGESTSSSGHAAAQPPPPLLLDLTFATDRSLPPGSADAGSGNDVQLAPPSLEFDDLAFDSIQTDGGYYFRSLGAIESANEVFGSRRHLFSFRRQGSEIDISSPADEETPLQNTDLGS